MEEKKSLKFIQFRRAKKVFSCTVHSEMAMENSSSKQSHYIEVAQGDIFMEQKMRFGLVLGRTEKKLGADYEQLLRVFYSFFQGQNFF